MNVFLLLTLICLAVFLLSTAELLYIYHLGPDEFINRKRKTEKDFGVVELSYLMLTYAIVMVGSLSGTVAMFLIYLETLAHG